MSSLAGVLTNGMSFKEVLGSCGWLQLRGTAFQKPVLAGFVTVLYRIAFRKVKYVFFENKENAREFGERNIVSADRQVVLPGAGINLEKYKMEPYPNHSRVHFLYLGRIMKEKGIEELFYAVRRLKEENEDFVLDLAGFFEDIYKKQVEELEQLGIAHFYGFQSDPRPFYAEADCVVLPSYHEGNRNGCRHRWYDEGFRWMDQQVHLPSIRFWSC